MVESEQKRNIVESDQDWGVYRKGVIIANETSAMAL